jgi:hypothetical protein
MPFSKKQKVRRNRNKRRRLRRRKTEESQSPKKLSKKQQARKLVQAFKQKRKYQKPDGVDYLALIQRRSGKSATVEPTVSNT